MGFLVFVLVAALVVGAAVVAGAVVLAKRSHRSYQESNHVIPGRPTRAPASWAGSHDPEAVLHRRLRDAMAALRANQAFDDNGALLDVRVELEEQALILDDELVAVAALPRLHRHEPLTKVTEAVNTIETAVAELASRPAVEAGPRLAEALRRIRERTTLIDEIRAELDQLPGSTSAAGPAPSTPPPAQPSPQASPPGSVGTTPPVTPPTGPPVDGPGETGTTGQGSAPSA